MGYWILTNKNIKPEINQKVYHIYYNIYGVVIAITNSIYFGEVIIASVQAEPNQPHHGWWNKLGETRWNDGLYKVYLPDNFRKRSNRLEFID